MPPRRRWIAHGAKATTLLKENGRLMAQDSAESIPAVLAQFTLYPAVTPLPATLGRASAAR
jgi:hypothetical protein